MLLPCLNKDLIEAGVDEAGRGCLAGPVVAAAVIFPQGYENPDLDDSKKLSAKERNRLRYVIEKEARAFGIAFVDISVIDEINILNASILAMHQALGKLTIQPQHILVDGNRFKDYHDIPWTCEIGGDERFMSIAAASILAKTYRDEFMDRLHLEFEYYHWNKNKGYATKLHREAILKFGISRHHRKSFKLYPDLELF